MVKSGPSIGIPDIQVLFWDASDCGILESEGLGVHIISIPGRRMVLVHRVHPPFHSMDLGGY